MVEETHVAEHTVEISSPLTEAALEVAQEDLDKDEMDILTFFQKSYNGAKDAGNKTPLLAAAATTLNRALDQATRKPENVAYAGVPLINVDDLADIAKADPFATAGALGGGMVGALVGASSKKIGPIPGAIGGAAIGIGIAKAVQK